MCFCTHGSNLINSQPRLTSAFHRRLCTVCVNLTGMHRFISAEDQLYKSFYLLTLCLCLGGKSSITLKRNTIGIIHYTFSSWQKSLAFFKGLQKSVICKCGEEENESLTVCSKGPTAGTIFVYDD